MQDLSSVQNLYFLKVVGLPIGLSPRTMQDLGSVQNLEESDESSYWTHKD